MRRGDFLYRELTYEIRGILYIVHNYLGCYRNEKQYGDATEYGLKKRGLKYEREKVLPISFSGERSGRNRVDFLVENKIFIELNVVPRITRNEYHQCLRYLASSDIQLLLLVNFYPKSLYIKRILSPKLLNKKNP